MTWKACPICGKEYATGLYLNSHSWKEHGHPDKETALAWGLGYDPDNPDWIKFIQGTKW